MSASEKLRAAAPWDQWREYLNADIMDLIEGGDMERVLNALPQIVAVVETAEKSVRWESVTSAIGVEDARNLWAALAALDEALT